MHRGTLEQVNGQACIATISSPNMGVDPFPHVLDRHRYSSPCPNRINITVTVLWVATPLLSTVSVAAVCVAVTTNQWLLTQENIKNGNYTGRGDQEFYPKNTVSGLWTLCYTNPGKQGFLCSNIEYFPKEEYSPDLKDSTMAIPYTVTKSAAFFILSTFLVFIGELCCLCGHFSRQRRLLTFISGVIFIISGLLMLIGLVMYISIFKAEVGGKLRPTSQLQPAMFTYKYGYSFILYVSGFVSTEISGTCAVFLYIYWHQKDWRKKGYDIRSKLVSSDILFDIDPIEGFYPFCRRHLTHITSNINGCTHEDVVPETFTSNFQRRLYLDRHQLSNSDDEDNSPIRLKHSLSCELLSNSLPTRRNLKVNISDINNKFSLPISINRCQQHLPSSYSYEFSPGNRLVKTAPSKIISNWTNEEFYALDDCFLGVHHDHEFIPFDLGESVASVPPNCQNSEKGLQENEIIYNILSKTTPV